MKVLHAAETVKGGVATVIRLLYAGIQAQDATVQLTILVPNGQRGELSDVPDSAIETFTSRGRGVLGCLSFALALFRSVISLRPDIVHLHSSFAGAIGRLVLLPLRPFIRFKVVYCPHAFSFLMGVSAKKAAIYARVERVLSRFCDAIICVSFHERDAALATGFPPAKLRVVRNGVVAPALAELDHRPSSTPKLNVLFVGRFDRQKGFDVLLDAMRRIDGSSVHLTAVGDSVYGGFEKQSRDNITYVGWVSPSDLDGFYAKADVLVMPSRWEGFAMVPLEAMSRGVPVLASNIPALTEIVEDHVNGRLFAMDDDAQLARVLLETPASDWAGMGGSAKRLVSAEFTAMIMSSATLDVYRSLTQAAPRASERGAI